MKYKVKRFSASVNLRLIEAKLRSLGYSDREMQCLGVELDRLKYTENRTLLERWLSGVEDIDPRELVKGWQLKEGMEYHNG